MTFSRAVIAGYGLDELGRTGNLTFLVESIVELDRRELTVDGLGRTGACTGDSGGPLLIRDDTGRVAVLGVLSVGESSCRGKDSYVRVDVLGDWIAEHAELPEAARPHECGALDERGRCFDELAVWCASGELRAERCQLPSVCGLVGGSGFRCSLDPICAGDERGKCTDSGTASARCSAGGAIREQCSTECAFDPRTGEALCVPA